MLDVTYAINLHLSHSARRWTRRPRSSVEQMFTCPCVDSILFVDKPSWSICAHHREAISIHTLRWFKHKVHLLSQDNQYTPNSQQNHFVNLSYVIYLHDYHFHSHFPSTSLHLNSFSQTTLRDSGEVHQSRNQGEISTVDWLKEIEALEMWLDESEILDQPVTFSTVVKTNP